MTESSEEPSTSRKMASIKTIKNVQPISDANAIELATIDGWQSVIRKDQFRVGDRVIFIEPDALLPNTPEFEFMRLKKFRVKTCRLRGALSQGICMDPSILPEGLGPYEEDFDVSEILGIKKYEPPIPIHLRGRVRCPIYRLAVPKTDETRVQNIPDVLERHTGKQFYMTEKLDGTSCSVFLDPETGLHVCSRNVDLAPDHEHKYNGTAYWDYCTDHNIEEILKTLGGTISLQGELFGEGIQKNKYQLKGLHYRVYNFWDMTNHCYLERQVMLDTVEAFGLGKDFLVPDLGMLTLNHSVNDLLRMANGTSKLADVPREGIVFRSIPEAFDLKIGRLSFKAVSPDFLLHFGE